MWGGGWIVKSDNLVSYLFLWLFIFFWLIRTTLIIFVYFLIYFDFARIIGC